MNLSPKSNGLQAHQTILYDRALHPELFRLSGRRVIRHADYELEMWVMRGAHLLRFEHSGHCATELVTDQEDNLPSKGVVSAALCAGDREFEHEFEDRSLVYMNSTQSETLSENLYAETLSELADHAQGADALVQTWDDESGACLSIVDSQAMNHEIHVQTYHMMAMGGVVLRTQSIFEHR